MVNDTRRLYTTPKEGSILTGISMPRENAREKQTALLLTQVVHPHSALAVSSSEGASASSATSETTGKVAEEAESFDSRLSLICSDSVLMLL